MMIRPKLVITDIDGVWTDGGMYYDNHGNEWKKFNTSDSAGVLFLRLAAIPLVIITGENVDSVKNRAKKLKIKHLYQGISNKLPLARELCREFGCLISEVAFIGDDINDYLLLQQVGWSACPVSAPDYIKEVVDYVTAKRGGEGAFREFVEKILMENDLFTAVLERYLKDKKD